MVALQTGSLSARARIFIAVAALFLLAISLLSLKTPTTYYPSWLESHTSHTEKTQSQDKSSSTEKVADLVSVRPHTAKHPAHTSTTAPSPTSAASLALPIEHETGKHFTSAASLALPIEYETGEQNSDWCESRYGARYLYELVANQRQLCSTGASSPGASQLLVRE